MVKIHEYAAGKRQVYIDGLRVGYIDGANGKYLATHRNASLGYHPTIKAAVAKIVAMEQCR